MSPIYPLDTPRTLGIDTCVVIGDAVNAAIEGRIDVDAALLQMHSRLPKLQREAVTM